MSTQVA